jgi:uncharacterized protein YjiS (DUF1127 family)
MTTLAPTLARRATFPRLIAEAFGSLRRQWARERTLATLRALDDRLLRDIGLSRDDLEAARGGRLPHNFRRFGAAY